MLIGDHLYFDMPRVLDVFLQIYTAVAKGSFCLDLCLLESRVEFQRAMGNTHAFSATTGSRFDEYGESDFVCYFDSFFF